MSTNSRIIDAARDSEKSYDINRAQSEIIQASPALAAAYLFVNDLSFVEAAGLLASSFVGNELRNRIMPNITKSSNMYQYYALPVALPAIYGNIVIGLNGTTTAAIVAGSIAGIVISNWLPHSFV